MAKYNTAKLFFKKIYRLGIEKDFLNIVIKSLYKTKLLSIIFNGPANGCFPPKVRSNGRMPTPASFVQYYIRLLKRTEKETGTAQTVKKS